MTESEKIYCQLRFFGIPCVVLTASVLNSALCAASGALGTTILRASGYRGIDDSHTAQAGGFGALGGLFFGFIYPSLLKFTGPKDCLKCCYGASLIYIVTTIFAGLIGQAILGDQVEQDTLPFEQGEVAAAFAIGGLLTALPLTPIFGILTYCYLGLVYEGQMGTTTIAKRPSSYETI